MEHVKKTKCACILSFTNGLEYIDKVPPDQLFNFPKPTVLCEYTNLWQSQDKRCCCTLHPKENCQQVLNLSECLCPRCCKDEDCDNCAKKQNYFFPCHHLKGRCATTHDTNVSTKSDAVPIVDGMKKSTNRKKPTPKLFQAEEHEYIDAVPLDEHEYSDCIN